MVEIVNAPKRMPAILAQMKADYVLSRLWAHDHTIWQEDPTEITNRLGWLHLPETMPKRLDEIDRFVANVRADGIRDVLLLGMGGSSLAPETFSITFGTAEGCPRLHVLDSTHPERVLELGALVEFQRTLILVATKSGTTTETLSFFRYFHREVADAVGTAAAGEHFAAITDPGSPLIEIAGRHRFRKVFENDPDLGGRYAALSHFGLVPATLLGVDVRGLLHGAREVSRRCAQEENLEGNPAARLGVFLGAAALEGRDKATLILSEEISDFGNWVEQLIAESTGKDGVGILPVVGEPTGPPAAYGADRLFIHLRVAGDGSQDGVVAALAEAGHPVARIDISDPLALGGQFFLWEMATAIVGHVLKINPFDQPNVEAAKSLAREMVKAYEQTGTLPLAQTSELAADAVRRFLDAGVGGDYVGMQAYLPPRRELADELRAIAAAIRNRWKLATTVGFGPRYLHSTGQLHKGDRGNGLFIQFVVDPECDVPIPSEDSDRPSTLTFGTLIAAQGEGDRRALLEAGRRVIAFQLDRERMLEQLRALAMDLS